MTNTEDPIQKAVEACAEKILTDITPSPPLLAVHFLCGEPDEPGYVRKSALRLNDKIARKLRSGQKNGKATLDPKKHREVLRRHVRLFERDNTALRLAVKAADENSHFWYRVGDQAPIELPGGWSKGNLSWPDDWNEFLAPRSTALEYLTSVYAGTTPSKLILGELDIHRAEAFGRWVTKATDSQKKERWEQISPLQSSLLYFSVAQTFRRQRVGGDFLVFSLPPIKDAQRNITPKVVVVLSPCQPNSLEVAAIVENAIKDVFAEDDVRKHLSGHKELEGRTDELARLLNVRRRQSDNFWKRLTSASAALPVPGHRDRFQFLALWIALLAKQLTGRRHENEPLEFWFLAGDLSEFEDDKDIIFDKKLPAQEVRKFSPASDGAKMRKHAETAAKLLEKEHFPWFEDGRHALFFDLSASEAESAVGLCAVKRSTWAHFYSEIYKTHKEQEREDNIRIPMCIIGCVSKRHGGTSIALCYPQSRNEKKLKMLFRLTGNNLRDYKWQAAEDKRHAELVKLLEEVTAGATPEQQDSVAELCVLVADNPRIGGTVVLLKTPSQFKRFLQMGEPWPFENLSSSDKAPLMAHDGATLVCLQNSEQYGYRYILTPDGISREVRDSLKNLSLCFESKSPLAGVGTRRWSAALAAFKRSVQAVIVVSQDGDITCWKCAEPKTCENAFVTVLPLGLSRTSKQKSLKSFLNKA
jgi:hypothetical protein